MKISVKEFKEIYYLKPNAEIAEIIGVKSVLTVRKYAKKIGLKPKGIGFMYPNDKRIKTKVEFI